MKSINLIRKAIILSTIVLSTTSLSAVAEEYKRDVRIMDASEITRPISIPEEYPFCDYNITLNISDTPRGHLYGYLDLFPTENVSGNLELYPTMGLNKEEPYFNVTATNFYNTDIESLYVYPFVGQKFDYFFANSVSPLPETTFLRFGEYAFSRCPKLKKITIFGRELNYGVFSECPELEYADLSPSLFAKNCLCYLGVDMTGYPIWEHRDTTVIRSIHSIPYYAFGNCPKLKQVFINNDSIKSIGSQAFINCESLKFKNLQKIRIYNEAFKNCTSLDTVETGCLTGDEIFMGCIGLKVANVDYTDYAYDDSKLGKRVFAGCTSLDSLMFTRNKTNPAHSDFCDDSVFVDCPNLRSLVLRTSRMSAKMNRDSIMTTRFPLIPTGTFADCPNIENIYLRPDHTNRTSQYTLPEVEDGAFANYNATLYIYKGMKHLIEEHPVWSKFQKIVEVEHDVIDDGPSSISTNEYDEKGIYIWTDNDAVHVESNANNIPRIQIYLMSGQLVYNGSEQTINLNKGTYIIKVGNKTQKIVIR